MEVLSEWDVTVNGDRDNPVRKMWNFPETARYYRKVDHYGISFKVAKTNDEDAEEQAARVLHKYQMVYREILKNMRSPAYKKKYRINLTEYQKHQVKLTTELHSADDIVAEIPPGAFDGMNKPYKIYLGNTASPDFPWIGPRIRSDEINGICLGTGSKCENNRSIADILGYLRPTKRQLFFNARKGYSKNLLVHELAHTAANHVMFRPDDHGKDFRDAERLILLFAKTKDEEFKNNKKKK